MMELRGDAEARGGEIEVAGKAEMRLDDEAGDREQARDAAAAHAAADPPAVPPRQRRSARPRAARRLGARR